MQDLLLLEIRTGYLVMLKPGERSAIIYSIIESCRRHDIEPYTYSARRTDTLALTNRQIKNVVPNAWAATRRNTALRAA
jgi:transposase